jgi:hypothetical protein
MSYYKLLQTDIIQASQLYLGNGVNAGLPVAGLNLYSDGTGGTFWSSVSGSVSNVGGITSSFVISSLTSTIDGLGSAGYTSTSYVTNYIGSTLSTFSTLLGPAIAIGVAGSGPGGTLTNSNLQSTVLGLGTLGYVSTIKDINGNIVPYVTIPTLSNYTQSSMTSTVIGLNNYLGYLSTNANSPVMYTSSIFASTLFTQGGITSQGVKVSSATYSNLWVAVGSANTCNATIEWSTDGLNWNNALSGGFSLAGHDVIWNGSLWVAVGNDANSNVNIQYSRDGKNWLDALGSSFSSAGEAVEYSGSIWVAVGTDVTKTIKYSYDAITWVDALGASFDTKGNAVKWNGSLWVATGASSSGSILYSYDGITWVAASQTGYSSDMRAAKWNGSFWLAGGRASSGNNQFSISQDGINWSNFQITQNFDVNGIHWNGILWIATVTTPGNSIYYSYDALKWVPVNAGDTFSIQGLDSDWNGNYWIAVGQDAVSLKNIKRSTNGINWTNSITNNFTTAVQNISYSSNPTPSYEQENFRILSQNIPNYGSSTNQILLTPTAMMINHTLYIDSVSNRLGINCNAPSYDLDVYGSVNISSIIYASQFSGDGSLLRNVNAISTLSLQSTYTGLVQSLGSLGYLSTPADFSSLIISSLTNTIFNSTLGGWFGSSITSLLNTVNKANTSTIFISTSFSTLTAFTINASSLTTSSLLASTITTSNLITSTFSAQNTNISTIITANATIQRLLVSSFRFYDGDGFVSIPDLQSSNVSTIVTYTSSILANTVTTTNFRLGNAPAQSPITFYGLRGAFNNTVIAEQSTGALSTLVALSTASLTGELLLFRGSSIGDQVRIQTTGSFRVETGVSGRLFPNTAQVSTPSFLIDQNSNIFINNSSFYFNASTGFIGINTFNPSTNFEIVGTLRSQVAQFSTLLISTTTIANLNAQRILVSSLRFYDGDGYVFIPDVQHSNVSTVGLWANTMLTNTIQANNFISTPAIITSSLTLNTLAISSLSIQTLRANAAVFSSLLLSTLSLANFTTQTLTTSSISFYSGDGIVNIPDLQGSNVSTIALYASSLQTNTILTSNIRIGNNPNFTPITFYGRTGAFNTTLIAEQSTGNISQELLIFKGSTNTDQIRFQTTGTFRIEAGAPARTLPNTGILPTPSFFIDATNNIYFNNCNLAILSSTSNVGINCNTPGVTLDVNGTIRGTQGIFTGVTLTTFATNALTTSSLTTSSITANIANISTLIPSTFYMNTLSSIYQIDIQNAVANFSTLAKVVIQPSLINIWVATGNGTNSLAYSFDGATWTGITSGATNFTTGGTGVAWNGVRFVATGNGTNSIAYSSNGINWTPIANSSATFTGNGTAIAWNGSRFIACGTGTNALAYSVDGINWIGISLSASTFTTQANGIAWNGRLWVAVGSGTNTIAYSGDGVTWTGITIASGPFSTQGNGIAWNGKLWVAVGTGTNSIAYSFNGVNWIGIPNTYINTFTTAGFGVAWNGLRFVAVGQGTNTIAYSLDGINWLGLGATIFTSQGNSIAWNGIRWVAVGSGVNGIAYSPDGITWTGIAYSSATFTVGGAGVGIAWSSNVPQAYSQQTLDINPQNIPTFFRSTNQIFNSISSMLINDTLAIDRGYNYVGVNCNVPQYTLDVAGSANFSTITKINIQPALLNRWVATGGSGTSIAYSPDGISWTGITGPFTIGNAVAWNGIRWVAVGTGGVNAIAYSPDGITWTGIPVSANTFTTSGRGVAWNGIRWVAVGGGTNAIAYSSDGINWTGIPYSVNTFTATGYGTGIAWNGTRWVATGQGTNSIAYSTDGITWTGILNTASPFFTTGANGIAWNGIRWVAVGQGTNTIAYSPDGINWTGVPNSSSIFSGFASGVAWNGFRWVAVGNGTNTIAYSADGITWFPVTNSLTSIFTSNGVAIAWSGTRWVAVGNGTNTIAHSLDGVNWTGISGTFPSFGVGVAYSSNVVPAYSQQNLDILPQNIPTFFRSTNQIFLGPSTILLNDTLIVDRAFDRVGINCNVPGVTLDVGGIVRANTAIISTLNASTASISSATISSLTVPFLTVQTALVSSLRFYDGDGSIFIADVQHSNVSTIAAYTSSILANVVTTSNIRIGIATNQSPITFYGLRGAYNNTAIVEQSTGALSTLVQLSTPSLIGELLLFRGSSIGDQIRVQTTGSFRVETGVSGRLFPNTAQVSTPSLLIDQNSNIFINNSSFYFNASTGFIGINTFNPSTNFEVIGTLRAQVGQFSTLFISTTSNANVNTQTLLVSSLRFYDGDGFIKLPDVQSSNVSTMALYASSITAPFIAMGNAYHGSNTQQTLINFYGTTGRFNNTAIVEQSTGFYSQELLFFRGSSISDQFRFQTTGGFRVETGVPSRLFPNTVQSATPSLFIDGFSNMAVNNNMLYVAGTTGFVGVNCNTPGATLDVAGAVRSLSNITVNSYTSTIFTSSGIISSLTVPSLTAQRLLVSSLRFFDGDGIVNIPDLQTSNVSTIGLWASNALVNSITSYNYVSTALLTASTFLLNTLTLSTLSTQVLGANSAIFSSMTTYNVSTTNIITQRLTVSSIKFYDGDGVINLPDIQSSNMSSMAMYTSSIRVNSITANATLNTFNIITSSITTNILSTGSIFGTSTIATNYLLASNVSTNFLYASSIIATTISTNILNVGTANISSMTISSINAPYLTSQSLLVSSLRFFDGDGIVKLPDLQSSNVSTIGLWANTFVTNSIQSYTYISTALLIASTLTVNNLSLLVGTSFVASTLSSQTILGNNASIINANISSLSTASFTAQRALFSSLRFYDGDGVVNIPDMQASNVSSIAMYTSSIRGNFIGNFTGNFLGVNCNAPLYNLDVNGVANVSSFTRINVIAPSANLQRWVAGGSGTNSLAYSDDGINWIGITGSANIFTTTGRGIAWNGRLWIAVGQGTNSIAYSSDGINWTGILTASSPFTTQGQNIAWNGNLWVAVGSGTNVIAYSLDGINWTGIAPSASTFTSTGYGIAWNGRVWVAVGIGTNSIAYSSNGINWTGIPNSASTFTVEGRGIAWNGRLWIAAGNGTNAFAYSTDNINWTGIPLAANTFTTSAYGIAWNGRLWIAVGQGTNSIAYSSDGINWTGIASSANTFTTYGYGIAWNGRSWVAVGSGTNSIAYSSDGVNWTVIASSANNFTTGGFNVAWSSNVVPSYTQPTLDILPSQNNGIPLFLRSTNQIFLAASSMTINATLSVDNFYNRVGINNTNPQFNLDVYGNSRISSLMIGDTASFTSTNTTFQLSVFGTNGPARVGGTTWTQISDQRLKEQIVDADLDRCYNDIKAIPLRRFTYTSSFFNTIALPDRNVLGFIAQEVKQVQPKAITVSEAFGISDLNWLNIDQMNMSLYGAVKRLMQNNEELTSSVSGLQTTLCYCMSTISGGNV